MIQYHKALRHVLKHGVKKEDRTGVGTLSVFGYQMRFNLAEGFPLLTTKKVNFKAVCVELLWFLNGETNVSFLHKYNVHIWDPWAGDNGELGPIYGYQWRKWPNYNGEHIDQIKFVVDEIKRNPNSRRLIVSAWNVADLEKMKLPPCHLLFQFYVSQGTLSCQLYQRSADLFIGVPFNIASYSLLTIMIARITNLKPGEFIHTFGDLHLYLNHLNAANEQLQRKPRSLPVLELKRVVDYPWEYELEDIVLRGYDPYPHIKVPVAV